MLLIGKIIGTRGLKGEVKIYPYTNSPEDFGRVEKVYLNEDQANCLILKKHKMHKNLIIALFEGINNIDKAEELKNTEIFLDKTEAQNFLADDSYFYKDIIGVDVISLDNEHLGNIKAVNTSAKQDIFIVERNGKEWMLPNVENFVKEVNLEENKIIVDLIEGLVDED